MEIIPFEIEYQNTPTNRERGINHLKKELNKGNLKITKWEYREHYLLPKFSNNNNKFIKYLNQSVILWIKGFSEPIVFSNDNDWGFVSDEKLIFSILHFKYENSKLSTI